MNKNISRLPVVLVDDESTVLLSSQMILGSAGIDNVTTLQDSRELLPLLGQQEVALVVLDLFMPYISGKNLLPDIARLYPDLPVIVMTAAQEVETAVSCMQEGAFDYLVKPVEESRFISSVRRALELRSLRQQVGRLKHYLFSDQLQNSDAFAEINTVSRKMYALFQYAEAIAGTGEPVLITGETGVGKELLAQSLHKLSERPGEFVPVNVAGLDDTLFSDTLFGHRKGAFSSADTAREGMVSKASGGTLFLDEIGDLSAASQVKLLRLLQERHYYPLGSDVAKRCDARILCATNFELKAQLEKDRFRSDLYYRLSVHQVDIPPLRERSEDIPLLVNHFLNEAADIMGKRMLKPPPELLTLLENYHFPGNVRELRAMIFDAAARHKSGGILSAKAIRTYIKGRWQKGMDSSEKIQTGPSTSGRFLTLKEAEQQHIEAAMRNAGGNQGIAAALLGISRPALNRRLARLKEKE